MLYTLAERSNTTVERIFSANPQLESPDLIEVGEKIRIPDPTEALPEREIPSFQPVSATLPASPAEIPVSESPALLPPPKRFEGFVGGYGYAVAGGNCVNEPGVKNPFDGTNPIAWAAFTSEPYIGATALWASINHTGVVTGLWPNGDVEVRHQNWSGTPITRFPRTAFRGYR